ncbi:hypothetical protein DOY81_005296, partial [Sarcophaga bullata]
MQKQQEPLQSESKQRGRKRDHSTKPKIKLKTTHCQRPDKME